MYTVCVCFTQQSEWDMWSSKRTHCTVMCHTPLSCFIHVFRQIITQPGNFRLTLFDDLEDCSPVTFIVLKHSKHFKWFMWTRSYYMKDLIVIVGSFFSRWPLWNLQFHNTKNNPAPNLKEVRLQHILFPLHWASSPPPPGPHFQSLS